MSAPKLSTQDRTSVREFLLNHFNLDELKNLAFDMGVDWERFKHEDKTEFTREIILHCERNEQEAVLLDTMVSQRTTINGVEALQNIRAKFGVSQAELAAAERSAAERFSRMPTGADSPIPLVSKLPPGSRMTLSPNPSFTGRDRELRTLAELLKANTAVSITAMGGMGKTQLAAEFAHRYGQFFGGVHWMSFADAEGVEGEIARCGKAMGITADKQAELVEAMRRRWAEDAPRLLIFDNCEDEKLFKQHRPNGGGCRALITKRNDKWLPATGAKHLRLLTLTPGDSLALLRKLAPELPADAATEQALSEIAAEVEHLPLALHGVGSYLAHYGADVAPGTVLDELRQRGLRAAALSGQLAGEELDTATRHTASVAKTFLLGFDDLRKDETPVNALALALFARAACFAPGVPFPRALLRKTAERSERSEHSDPLIIAEALNALEAHGLIYRAGANDLRLHRLLAAFAHAQLASAMGAAQDVVEQAVADEAETINARWLPAPLLAWQAQLRFLADAAAARGSPHAGRLSNELGFHLHMIGDRTGARVSYERALNIDENGLGPEHPDVARDINNLGMLMRSMGDYAGARTAFERAIKIGEAAYGPEHPKVARYVNNLGLALYDLSDYAAARVAIDRALKIDEAAFGPEHPNVAIDVNNLGMVLEAMGDYGGARMAYERALKIDETTYGPEHPNVATRVNNIGGAMKAMGDYAGARTAYERALKIDEATYGPEHTEVAMDSNNLGSVMRLMGDFAAAQVAFERALRIWRTSFGEEHPYVAFAHNNLGTVMRDMGDLAGAQEAFERALKKWQASLGEEHPRVATAHNNLGIVLQRKGDLAGAQTAFERALAISEAAYGPEHPDVARAVDHLGEVMRDMGDLAGARAAFERAIRIFERFLSPDHANARAARQNLDSLPQA